LSPLPNKNGRAGKGFLHTLEEGLKGDSFPGVKRKSFETKPAAGQVTDDKIKASFVEGKKRDTAKKS